jgi:H+/gluconate symporter-like permease
MTEKLGTARAILAVTLAGAIVTYGGVSLFVALFVLVPMGRACSRPPTSLAVWCLRRSRSAP